MASDQNLLKNERQADAQKFFNRSVWVMIIYIKGVAVLPTRLMVHLFMKILSARITHVWGDGLRNSKGLWKYHLMSFSNPRPVDSNLLQPLFQHCLAKSSANLASSWRDCGIVEDVEGSPDAPLKVNWSKLSGIWGSHALLMTINGFVKCTCPMHCQTGHCPHKYEVEGILDLKVHVRRWEAR